MSERSKELEELERIADTLRLLVRVIESQGRQIRRIEKFLEKRDYPATTGITVSTK